MLARLVVSAALLAAMVFCAGAFDAASSLKRALQIANEGVAADESEVRTALLMHARDTLDQSWSQPLLWSGDALEARSWIASLNADAEGANRSALDESERYAAYAITRSPLQPVTWLRLAALTRFGVANPYCDGARCLALSWKAAAAARFEFACARVREAHALGALEDDDIRLDWLARTGVNDQMRLRNCISFVPPERMFTLLAERPVSMPEAIVH